MKSTEGSGVSLIRLGDKSLSLSNEEADRNVRRDLEIV